MYKKMAGAIALSCVCATAMAGYGFEPIAALAPDAAAARAVAVGDVTGDGRDDVVLIGAGSHPFYRNRVVIYAQTPGGFAPPVAIDFHPDPTGYHASVSGLGLADLDADGDLDIVVSHSAESGGYPFASALTVLRNDADGFTAAAFASEESLRTFKFMDVDGDGNLDLVGQSSLGSILVFPGDGAAGFGEVAWQTHNLYPSTFDLIDMDGDDSKDLVYKTSEGIYAQLNDGAGFSSTPRTLLTLGNVGYFAQMAVADFDGDDRADLAVAFDSWPSSRIMLYPQGKDGRFRRKQLAGRAGYVSGLRAGDLDRDGREDLLMLDQPFNSQLGVMLAGARGFTPRTAYAAGAASDFALGDLNDDGMTDVVLFGNDEGVSYLLGRASAMEGDLAVFLGLNAGAAVVRIENRGGDFSVGGYELSLRVDPRIGSIDSGTAPDGCEAYDWNGLLEAYCQMPALAPGAFHELAFPFEVTAPTQRNLLFGRARASSSSPELRLDNNVVSKRVDIMLPAE